ncbi:uncharacterized protein LOC125001017 [Mugil cephalus]|uniref:uncharacterized protein LOC125001017 n=1 Tax=Mugil cephalus TaxID=48193 RepID=UPI001FB858FB|nr:uncharacterized protein LOC125001017 [Mugil cephalus]
MKTCYLLLLLGLVIPCGAFSDIYQKVGNKVVLSPGPVTDDISNIVWKHGPNIAMMWSGDKITSYQELKDRCTLNLTTGELTISNLTLKDSGNYTAEINNKILGTTEIMVILPVPKPTISISCNDEKTHCVLTCEGNTTGVEQVSYYWTLDDMASWSLSKEINITKEEMERFISCTLENPVSYKYSDRVNNPIARDIDVVFCLVVTALVLIGVGGVVGVGVLLFYKCKGKKGASSGQETTGVAAEAEETPTVYTSFLNNEKEKPSSVF